MKKHTNEHGTSKLSKAFSVASNWLNKNKRPIALFFCLVLVLTLIIVYPDCCLA